MSNELEKKLSGLSPQKRALLEKKLKQKAAEKAMEKVRKQHIPPRQGDGPWPASMDQTAFWFFHQMDPDFYAYNNGPTLRLTGPLQIPVMEAAASELLRRHEILRTIFRYENDQLYQEPVKDPVVICPVLDISDEPTDTLMDRAHQEVTRLFREPFDMRVFPLIRFNLIKLGEDDYLVALVAHHAIIDWWTLKLIPRELLTIYYAMVKGQPSPLPELPVQFIDYTIWRNNWQESADFDKQLTYWLDHLKGAPLVLDLPKDRPRPAQQDFSGERLYRRMPLELLEGIRKINIRLNASSLMTCISGTLAFLSRYSGQRDLLIGTPTTDRERKELENMAGYMLNVLIIRGDLTQDPTFAEFVIQMKKTVLDALANKELPFRMLVEKLCPQRNLSHMPIYQVDFNHVAIDGPVFETFKKQGTGVSLPGYDISGFPMDRGISDVDLQINYDEGLDEGRIVMEWASALFDNETGEHMGDLLVRLFTNLTQNPDVPISQVSWLSDAEKEKLLVDWNGRTVKFPRYVSLGDLMMRRAEADPGAVAVIEGEQTWTFAQLTAQANRMAQYLVDQGVGIGDPVGLCLPQGFDWVASMVGILRAGGAYVPLDSTYPQDRIAYMLEDTGMTTLITHSDMMDHLPAHELNFLNLLVLDEDTDMIDAYDGRAVEVSVPTNAPAYIIYTSGTTGIPKGVVVPHRAVSRLVFDPDYITVEPGDGIGQASNISFDAHVFEVYTALIHGARLVIVPKETYIDAAAFAATIQQHHIVTMFITTSLFSQFSREKPAMFASCKHILVGGERVDPDVLRRVQAAGPPKNLLNVYGPTETTTFASWYPIPLPAPEAQSVPIGKPIANTRLYILDKGNMLAPVGVVGELCIAGDALASGYLGDPKKTALKFVPNPFAPADQPGDRIYRSGDLVRRLRDGYIDFHGRLDTQVKVRGFRIELGEVEAALAGHEQIGDALALVRKTEQGMKRLLAYIVPSDGALPDSIDLEAVNHYLDSKLPDYMQPAVIIPLSQFPITPNGKVDRNALPDPGAVQNSKVTTAPRTAAERTLCEIWQAQLDLDQVGIHDNFFELGGDSIMGIQTIAAANRAGLSLNTKHLFQFQTIAELADQVGEVSGVVADQGTITGTVPLTPVQSWFLNGNRKAPHHFNIGLTLIPGEHLDSGTLEKAVERLVAHHDALRLRFRQVDGVWHQEHADTKHFALHYIDLTAETEPEERLTQLADQQQAAMDLAEGPLLQVILADLPHEQRLLVLVHHLVFDGISSRILVEDLETIVTALKKGGEPHLLPKSTSWQYWSQRLTEYAASETVTAQLPWWRALVEGETARLPQTDGDQSHSTTQSVHVSLDEDLTRKLLQDVPAVYNTRINDFLLASLAMAVADMTGYGRVRIDLEGHGREEIFDDVDFSRTIGWFTTIYPVALDLTGGVGEAHILKSVKEQLRAIPGNGLGYGLLRYANPETAAQLAGMPAQISFNYLGRMGDSGGATGLLRMSSGNTGHEHAPDDHRDYPLEVVGVTAQDRLNLFYNFSGQALSESDIQALADRQLLMLQHLIEHCLLPDSGGCTPSDFPHVDLTQAQVDELLSAYPDLEDIFPATGLQSGMLFHALLEPDTKAYRQQMCLFLPGDLDTGLFQKAWQQVIDRHQSLRTLHRESGGGFLQVVLKQFKPTWTLETLANKEQLSDIRNTRLMSPLALDKAPLNRFGLYHLEGEGTYFIWDHHHVNLDGWSMPIIIGEVGKIYKALQQGIDPDLAPVCPYSRYVHWLQQQDTNAATAHWKQVLANFDEPCLLVTKKADKAPFVRRMDRMLSKDDSAALEQFARVNALTMSTIFQGVWALTLASFLNRDDIVFGVTGSGRPPELADVERLVGMFLSTLPLRTRLDWERSIVSWLKSLQEGQVESRQYEYSALAEIQGHADVAKGHNLFDTLVVYENYPLDRSVGEGFGGQGIGSLDMTEETNYPMTLQSGPGETVLLRLCYNAHQFDETYVNGLLSFAARIMEILPEYGARPLKAMPLLDKPTRTLLLEKAGGGVEYPRDLDLVTRFQEVVADDPKAIALVAGSQQVTYGTLADRGFRLAQALRARGVRSGDFVAISMAEENPDLVAGYLGILAAGAAYMPLDLTQPDARIRVMLADAAPVCLIGEEPPFDHGIPVQSMDTLDAFPADRPALRIDAGQPAYIMYTSGSTGTPKGVVIPHRAVNRLVTAGFVDLTQSDVLLQAAVTTFDAATFEIWGALLHGARTVLMPARSIETIPATIEKEGVTGVFLTTQLFNLIATQAFQPPPTLKWVLTGGEQASRRNIGTFRKEHHQVALKHVYGPTESTTFATCGQLPGDDISIGQPIHNTTVHIVDQRLNRRPFQAAGEMVIGGDGLAMGYLNNPAMTAEKFVPDPFATRPGARLYQTGDIASVRLDGYIDFIGRLDHQVKIRGFRIELGEVAHALRALPYVDDVLVRAQPQNAGDPSRLVAWVCLRKDGDQPVADAADLRKSLAASLPEYMIPVAYAFVDALPLKANGKIDTAALPDPDEARAAYIAPQTETQEKVAAIWSEILDVPRISITENFFDLGGHSLTATRVVSTLRATFLVEIPVKAIFESSTVEKLAEYIDLILWNHAVDADGEEDLDDLMEGEI